jgi:hypothetical protein
MSLNRLNTGIVGSNPCRGMAHCSRLSLLCYPMQWADTLLKQSYQTSSRFENIEIPQLVGTVSTLKMNSKVKVKGKGVPLQAMTAPGGRGGIAPTHSQPRH